MLANSKQKEDMIMINKTVTAVVVTLTLLLSHLLLNTLNFSRKTACFIPISACSQSNVSTAVVSFDKSSDIVMNTTKSESDLSASNATTDNGIEIEILKCDTCISSTLDEYLIAVVMSEMPYTFEREALRAQAVASRTYALRLMCDLRHGDGRICADANHCTAYLDKEEYISKYGRDCYEAAYAAVSDAVKSTDGVIITYEGKLCCAVYHSSSCGRTENSYDLWGTYTPYLVSVGTPENAETQFVSIDKATLEKYIGNRLENDEISIKANDAGRCDKLVIGDTSIDGKMIRSAFGLNSTMFDVAYNGDNISFTVYGYGHGIGMSQCGANAMAKEGCSYEDILTHYYSGVEVEIYDECREV